MTTESLRFSFRLRPVLNGIRQFVEVIAVLPYHHVACRHGGRIKPLAERNRNRWPHGCMHCSRFRRQAHHFHTRRNQIRDLHIQQVLSIWPGTRQARCRTVQLNQSPVSPTLTARIPLPVRVHVGIAVIGVVAVGMARPPVGVTLRHTARPHPVVFCCLIRKSCPHRGPTEVLRHPLLLRRIVNRHQMPAQALRVRLCGCPAHPSISHPVFVTAISPLRFDLRIVIPVGNECGHKMPVSAIAILIGHHRAIGPE